MSSIQKTLTALVALAITLIGATLATAPLVTANSQPAATSSHIWR